MNWKVFEERLKKKKNMKARLRDMENRMKKTEIHEIDFSEDTIERMRGNIRRINALRIF